MIAFAEADPMNPSGKSPRRLVIMTVVACAVLLIVAAAAALGRTGSSREPSRPAAGGPTGAGVSSVSNSGTASNASGIGPVAAITTIAEGSSIASPAWCSTGPVPRLTVMGQATIKDQSCPARDAAIAEAVADATDQAQAAADAAGIHLGTVLDMQISAIAIVSPIEATVSPNSGIAVGSTGSSGAGSEPGVTGVGATPDRYLGSATGHDHLGDRLAKPDKTPEWVLVR